MIIVARVFFPVETLLHGNTKLLTCRRITCRTLLNISRPTTDYAFFNQRTSRRAHFDGKAAYFEGARSYFQPPRYLFVIAVCIAAFPRNVQSSGADVLFLRRTRTLFREETSRVSRDDLPSVRGKTVVQHRNASSCLTWLLSGKPTWLPGSVRNMRISLSSSSFSGVCSLSFRVSPWEIISSLFLAY